MQHIIRTPPLKSLITSLPLFLLLPHFLTFQSFKRVIPLHQQLTTPLPPQTILLIRRFSKMTGVLQVVLTLHCELLEG